MKHLSKKYYKAVAFLSVMLLTTFCGYSQCYRHAHIYPYAIDHSLMTMNAIARQAIFADLVLHDFSNDAIYVPIDRSAAAKLYAEEIAINTTGALAYDLLSLTDINDRDLRNAGIALSVAQLALSAAAIHNAEKKQIEAIEEQQVAPDSTLNDRSKLKEQRRKENRALSTLAIIGAAAWTFDALFGGYPVSPRHRYYHHHRHYYPYY